MPLDFPSNPTNGQVYTSGTRSWTYSSTLSAWDGGGYSGVSGYSGYSGIGLSGYSGISGYSGPGANQTLNTTSAVTFASVSATTVRAASAVYDVDGELRVIPLNSQTSNYTLTIDDVGKFINITTGGVNLLANRFAAGDQFLIYNNSVSNQTLSGQASTVLRLAGSATTGSRTIAQYGLCSVLCVSANIFVVAGTGVS